MPKFVKVATKSQIPLNSIREFSVNGSDVAIANLSGEFLAVQNTCTHDGGPLGEGEVFDGCCVECPRHGARFDLKTGVARALPATEPIKTYELKVSGQDIMFKIQE